MRLHVKTLVNKKFVLELSGNYTVDDIKSKLYGLEGIPKEKQRLVFMGEILKDPIDYERVRKEGVVFLLFRESAKCPCCGTEHGWETPGSIRLCWTCYERIGEEESYDLEFK